LLSIGNKCAGETSEYPELTLQGSRPTHTSP
jgi:hypothetical protein